MYYMFDNEILVLCTSLWLCDDIPPSSDKQRMTTHAKVCPIKPTFPRATIYDGQQGCVTQSPLTPQLARKSNLDNNALHMVPRGYRISFSCNAYGPCGEGALNRASVVYGICRVKNCIALLLKPPFFQVPFPSIIWAFSSKIWFP